MFVIQNLTSPPFAELPEGVTYLVCQHERGDNQSRDHLQGYIELARSQTMNWVQNHVHPSMHLQTRFGSQEQAIKYCTKEETRIDGPWEFGEKFVTAQGKRSDLILLREHLEKGGTIRELIMTMPHTLARYYKFAMVCKLYMKPDKRPPVVVHLLFGTTGAGKTTWVDDLYDKYDLYFVPLCQGRFWVDGYDGERAVLLDDFYGDDSGVSISSLLQLLNPQRLRVPVKGAFVWWMPRVIYITTNVHPRQWYLKWVPEHYRSLERRVTYVYDCKPGQKIGDSLVDRGTFFTNFVDYTSPSKHPLVVTADMIGLGPISS